MDVLRAEAKHIDGCLSEVAEAAGPGTLIIICGDHPVHAGPFKRSEGKSCVALIMGRA
jgi:hypothetical protein